MTWPSCTIFLSLLLLNMGLHVCGFNRSNVGVLWDPRPYFWPGTWDADSTIVNKLIPPITTISSEFSHLSWVVGGGGGGNRKHLLQYQLFFIVSEAGYAILKLIPLAVATYNSLHLKANETPLELSTYLMILPNRTSDHVERCLRHLVSDANEANNIYPGTVKRIYVGLSTFLRETGDRDIKEFENFLADAKFPENTTHEIGAALPLYYCAEFGLPLVLRHLSHITFIWWPNSVTDWADFSGRTPQAAIEVLSAKFEECQQTIRDYGINISLQVYTGWKLSNNETDGSKHDKNLIDFWSLVSGWAIKSGVEVVFDSAFGSGIGYFSNIDDVDHMGWWKVVENPVKESKQSSPYIFIEKRKMLLAANVSVASQSLDVKLGLLLICLVLSIS